MAQKRYQQLPKEPTLLCIHSRKFHAESMADWLIRIFPKIGRKKVIEDDLDFHFLGDIIPALQPHIVVIGDDLSKFIPHSQFKLFPQRIITYIREIVPRAIIIYMSQDPVLEPLLGVDVYYHEGQSYGELLDMLITLE